MALPRQAGHMTKHKGLWVGSPSHPSRGSEEEEGEWGGCCVLGMAGERETEWERLVGDGQQGWGETRRGRQGKEGC